MHPVIEFVWSLARWNAPDRLKATLGRGCPYRPFHDEYRAIFIHVPKTGGNSVGQAVFGLTVHHRRASTFRYYDPERFGAYFKFGFVRNPYDRLVSAYEHLRRPDVQAHGRGLAMLLGLERRSFPEFVQCLDRHRWAMNFEFMVPAHRFLCDGEEILVDYVGCTENMDRDFPIVADRLGLSAELPRLNVSPRQHGNYRNYYDIKTRDIVERLYHRDLELFGYSF